MIGGGYIGLEMAEALVMRGLQVALVERGEAVMGNLDSDMGDLVSQALRDVGVDLYLGNPSKGSRHEATWLQGSKLIGGRCPRTWLSWGSAPVKCGPAAAAAGALFAGASGAIKVNARMQTDIEGVWAAGDCAEAFHLVSRRPVNIALGTIANKQGRVCGINLGGGYATFPGVVGTAVSKNCQTQVARTGANEREAAEMGLQYVVGKTESTTRASYFPGAGKITIKVLAERGSGRMLGAQIVGVEGAAKRIDVFATALFAGMTISDFMYLDLSYAPPFAPVWDPILIAARNAAEQL